MKSITEISKYIERKKGERDLLLQEIAELQHKLLKLKIELIQTQKAQAIILDVSQETQRELELGISEPVTDCLQSIFGEKYKAIVKFVLKSGRTICDLKLKKGNLIFHPLHSNGGGVADAYSIGLIFALWSLSKTSNIIILDEPFRHLSPDMQVRASELLNEVSKERDIQLILITNLKLLGRYADRLFHVTMETNDKGQDVTKIERIK